MILCQQFLQFVQMQHMDTSKLSNLQDNSPLLILLLLPLQDPEYYISTIMRERKAEEITHAIVERDLAN